MTTQEENGNGETGWVFDETKACAKVIAERRRLAKKRNERTTAKERLEKAHRENQLAMSAARAVKKQRLAKAREYAIEVKLGFQKDLELEEPPEPYGIRPGPGRCCPDAHYVDGRCTGCGHEEKVG